MKTNKQPIQHKEASGGAICGVWITYSAWLEMTPKQEMGNLMAYIRKREIFRGHYRYKLIDRLSDTWRWEDRDEGDDDAD